MAKTTREWTNDADGYVAGHIYALEAKTVNELYAQYERAYINLQIALESAQSRYGQGDTWSMQDAYARQRTEFLIQQVMAEMQRLTDQSANTAMQASLDAYNASLYGHAWIADTVTGGYAQIPLLPVESVRAAILAPYQGSTWVDRWKGKDDEFQRRIRQSIVQSQIEGETIYQAQKRIASQLGIDIGRRTAAARASNSADFNRTQMIARTEILRSSNLGAMAVYQANSDVLDGWEYLTAKDDRVCDICGPLDGNQYAFGDNSDMPPQHPACRCTALPSLKNKEIENAVVGETETFTEWAARKGIDKSRYGNVYDLSKQKPPKQGKG